MKYKFPNNFIWGTSTASTQIETASNHEWKDEQSKDGYYFNRTSDHEKRRSEDANYIEKLGNAYRLSLDWSRLQTKPMQKFDAAVVEEYRDFLKDLKGRNIYIMLVCHHFTNPIWFHKMGNWYSNLSVTYFSNYVEQLVTHFGDLVDNWNTFNEPGVYISGGFLFGNFPPHQKNLFKINTVLNNLSSANEAAVKIIKAKYPNVPVGISKNCVSFYPINFLGILPAKFVDHQYMHRVTDAFAKPLDYIGMSYYGRIGFNPGMVSEIHAPGKLKKLGKRHDKMWEYYPKGIYENILRLYRRYKKPIIITENGMCTDDSSERIESIKDYLKYIHLLISEGIPVQGYFHWSTLDNFEWDLGPSYRFGLVHVNFEDGSFDRTMKPCGEFYSEVVKQNGFS